MNFEIEELTTLDALERLQPEWIALTARCSLAAPFHRPEWLLPWWRHFGTGDLWAIAVRDRGRLAGLAPLYIHACPEAGLRRQLSPIGVGVTDYCDFLFEPDSAMQAASTLVSFLQQQQHRWESADLQGIRPSSPLLYLRNPSGLRMNAVPAPPSLVIALPQSYEALLSRIAAVDRRNIRRARRNFFDGGRQPFHTACAGDLPEALEILFRLHQDSWHDRSLPGLLGDPSVQDFHREVARGFLNIGWLRLHLLFYKGAPAAALYGFSHGSRAWYYLGGFDSKLKRLSPGTVIMSCAIEAAIQERRTCFDFLRGKESYKFVWGAHEEPTFRLLLQHEEVGESCGRARERPHYAA